MMIDANLLPFNVNELVKSKAWHKSTPEQRKDFIRAGITFATTIEYYANKYRNKKTLKGEFIACVLWDFYYDLFAGPVENGSFDYELDWVYDADSNNIDEYSKRLVDEAIHAKSWIKKLKKAYRDNEEEIIKYATDENTGKINLELVNDFSVEYRDYLY